MNKTQRFFESMRDSKVAFIGTGVSHIELIRLFLRKGIDVTVLDKKDRSVFDDELYEEFSSKGAKFILGESYLDTRLYFLSKSPQLPYFEVINDRSSLKK